MNPESFIKIGIRLYGRKHWKLLLARDLGLNPSTIHRMTKREQIPGPIEVALKGLAEHKRRQDELDRAVRKRLPRGYKKWNKAPKHRTILNPRRQALLEKKNESLAIAADDVHPPRNDAGEGAGPADPAENPVPEPGGEVQGDLPERAGGETADDAEQRDS